MELQKQPEVLKFKWKDITFHVRAKATAGDRFEMNTAHEVDLKGEVRVTPRALYNTLICQFVTGWEGVTSGGKAVPFSMENLANLPADKDEDVILKLGSFIFKHCGLFPIPEEVAGKNA